MASVCNNQRTTNPKSANPKNPRQAARRRARVDKLLDPGLFRVLGEPTRANVLGCLIKCGRGCSVTEVAGCCSIDFSVVARHLSTLAREGVLESHKDGRKVIYEADAAGLAARFRELADAIDEWERVEDCCGADGCCGA